MPLLTNGAMQHAKLCDIHRILADNRVFSFDKPLLNRLTPRWPTGERNVPSLIFYRREGLHHIMNKNELIAAVADQAGLTKADASKAVEAVFDTITAALKKNDDVRLVGFGTFSVSKRKASTGRNPRTGEPMTIAASTQPKFKAGKGLKDAVN